MNTQELNKQLSGISNEILIEKCEAILTDLCNGGKKFIMNVPPTKNCSDLLITELITRFKSYSNNSNLNWININDQLPEDCEELLIIPTEDDFPLRTKKILVYTDMGDVYDNSRLKMMVGDKEWTWFMGVEGNITDWAIFEEPINKFNYENR